MAELLRSALETVRLGWRYESVFRCLRTGFFPCVRDDVDKLENYVLEFGLRGRKRWLQAEDWNWHRRYSLDGETEEADEESDYEISYVVTNPDETLSISGTGNSTGFVEANENLTITFTNTQEVLPLVAPTAVKDNSMSFMIMLILSSTCFAGAVVQKERKRKGGQDKSTNDEKM